MEKEKVKIALAITRLRMDADDVLMKEFSEAYSHGADILEDYLKHLESK